MIPLSVECWISLNEISKIVYKKKEGCFAVMISIFTSYLDESADEKRKDVFCVGAILIDKHYCAEIEKRWVNRLRQDEIEYFSTTNCKAVQGPFWKLRKKYGSFSSAKKIADKIRADLEQILLSSSWVGFGIGIVLSDYNEILGTIPIARKFYSKDSTTEAYSQTMFEIVRAVRRESSNYAVAYVIDDSMYSNKIIDAFKALKINHPILAKSVATILPLDDKTTPFLQMADLIANITKDNFLEWLNKGKPRSYPLEVKWRSHFEIFDKLDKPHMLRNLSKNIKSKRFIKGSLPFRPEPKPSRHERKQRRKAFLKKSGVIN